MRIIEGGGVTAPSGYRAAGIQTGVKESGAKDLALVYSTRPAHAAAVYTTNKVQGAPIAIDREHLADGKARAVILNSGKDQQRQRTEYNENYPMSATATSV